MSARMQGNKNLLGHRHSPEARARISAALKGKPKSPEWRAAMVGNRHVLDATVKGECVYCWQPATTYDHHDPDGPETVPCCLHCNSSKGRRTPEEWLAAGLHNS